MATRHCFGENVQVHEASGKELAPLLRDVADLLDEQGDGYTNVITNWTEVDGEGQYVVMVYAH